MNYNVRQQKVIEANDDKILCLATAAAGKAIRDEEIIPTAQGMKKVKDIKVGDFLFDRMGHPTKVLGVFPQGELEVFKITLGDGRAALCSKDHIWSINKKTWKNKNKYKNFTVEELLKETLINPSGMANFYIPCSKAVQYSQKDYSIHPYVIGAFLGSGRLENNLAILSEDEEIPEKISKLIGAKMYQSCENSYLWVFYDSETCKSLKAKDFFKKYFDSFCQCYYNKSIPEEYKYGSIEQRIQLIQGLMDTNGCIMKDNKKDRKATAQCSFFSHSHQLINDVKEVLGSLGYVSSVLENKRNERQTGRISYQLNINIPNKEKNNLFSSSKKVYIAKTIRRSNYKRKYDRTSIKKIESMGYKEPMTCFYVDNNEHLFLMNDFIVTHNTKVLTERVRRIIEQGCSPEKIACITFTNMAAEEMKKRLGDISKGAYIGTIHGLANNICIANGINTDKYIADMQFDKIIEKAMTIPRGRYPYFEHLLVDEFQDTCELEYNFIEKIPKKNFFCCGDERQCQPAGTKVQLRNGVIKNIEDIRVGDSVTWFSPELNYICENKINCNSIEKKVERISVRDFSNDYLITLITKTGKQTQYTPNHIGFVKLYNLKFQYAVCLMCNELDEFRIGKIFILNGDSLQKIMNREHCTKLWILKTFKTNKEATRLEELLSCKYEIPRIQHYFSRMHFSINDIYINLNTYNSAKICLEKFYRNINYPLLDNKKCNINFNRNAVTQIYACNIMPEIMDVLVYDESKRSNKKYEKIKQVKHNFITKPIKVYSLQIEGGTYIADEIVTHNCIYGFKGSTDRFLKDLYNDPTCKKYYLIENYRNAPNIVSFADSLIASMHKLSPQSKAVKQQDGYVNDEISFYEAIEQLEWSGDWGNWFILCRTNNELATALEILDERNIPCVSFKKGDLDLIKMESLLKDNRVKVLTIHSAKGLQNKHVIVTGAKTFNEEERKIAYVAATRAEQSLYWTPSICKRGKKNRAKNRDKADAGRVFEKVAEGMVSFE